jgi:hypothetical protein
MDKHLVQKIEDTHDAVLTIKADLAASQRICIIMHKQVDARFDGLHRVVKGKDGETGLVKELADLKETFDKLFTRLAIWAGVGGGLTVVAIYLFDMWRGK